MKILVFSGTGDGRELCDKLAADGKKITECVATAYGASLIDNTDVHVGRMDKDEMMLFMKDYDVVIDATHPYAFDVTKNIATACASSDKKYLRLIRDSEKYDNVKYFGDIKETVQYLKNTDGQIFVSTGSKELSEFKILGNRIKARVLDTESVRKLCEEFIDMEIEYKIPPFSYDDNIKDFKDCKFIVTKDSGKRGGIEEKIKAAHAVGAEVLIISRPQKETGYSAEEIRRILCEY